MAAEGSWELETPEALDRALRPVHARGGEAAYQAELAKVLTGEDRSADA